MEGNIEQSEITADEVLNLPLGEVFKLTGDLSTGIVYIYKSLGDAKGIHTGNRLEEVVNVVSIQDGEITGSVSGRIVGVQGDNKRFKIVAKADESETLFLLTQSVVEATAQEKDTLEQCLNQRTGEKQSSK